MSPATVHDSSPFTCTKQSLWETLHFKCIQILIINQDYQGDRQAARIIKPLLICGLIHSCLELNLEDLCNLTSISMVTMTAETFCIQSLIKSH